MAHTCNPCLSWYHDSSWHHISKTPPSCFQKNNQLITVRAKCAKCKNMLISLQSVEWHLAHQKSSNKALAGTALMGAEMVSPFFFCVLPPLLLLPSTTPSCFGCLPAVVRLERRPSLCPSSAQAHRGEGNAQQLFPFLLKGAMKRIVFLVWLQAFFQASAQMPTRGIYIGLA